MKKFIVSALLIPAFAFYSPAQSFHIGPKVGANFTKIEGQSFEDGFKLSYQLGAFAEIDFTKKLGVQPEVLLSQVSSRTTTFNANLAPSSDYKLTYLSIPVLLRINAGNMVTFHVGPQYSILLNNEKSVIQNGKDAFKSGDFSMIGGLQLNISSLKIYGRYSIGLSNINDIDNKETWKNQQIQLGIGLRII
ncbi:MAG: PorT family protein [Chitinophagaceae bacterium]|nr:PorT family protein [Chitinophagaceae bacterium]